MRALVLASLLLLGASAVARAAQPVRQGLDLRVMHAPQLVRVEGRERLVYEMHLVNFASAPIALREVQVLEAATRREFARFGGAALAARSADVGAAQAATALAPGAHRIVYVEFDLASGATPRALLHRIALDEAGTRYRLDAATVALPRRDAVRLAAPLRGGPWVAIHHADWPRGHRRVPYAIDGTMRIPGRHAIDFVLTDADGRIARGDADVVANHLGYRAEVLAVADARVAAMRDDLSETATLSAHAKQALADASGNYVALDLGDGRFAFYEHLAPGSVTVHVGQRVRRGEVIGALGFTGDSTGPHLHFHVADAASPLAAEGLPFVFERFALRGHYREIGDLGRARWTLREDSLARVRRRESPGQNAVVDFDAGDAAR